MNLRIQNWIFEWLQRRCQHLPEWVSVDILEGDYTPLQVHCCNRCGAVRVIRSADPGDLPPWREPRATWTERVVF